ncbi:hypothetical protein ONK29_25710, partial [Salmonella enterica subsp. enterica serovar Anatum]|nr:hypothetical protein [Salmonella enterica subsp. enterica serovar Anatum]
ASARLVYSHCFRQAGKRRRDGYSCPWQRRKYVGALAVSQLAALPTRFSMEKQIGALEKIANQHPENPVGQFCYWHFSRIARVLR